MKTKTQYPRGWRDALLSLIACAVGISSATAIELKIDRPDSRQFVLDLGNMISAADEARIQEICDPLLTEKWTPIIVVTIDSMAKYGGEGWRIETFATVLFGQWEIGHDKLDGQYWNKGILLLISKEDRKARIELGGGWAREKNAVCQQIMDQQIIPRFKRGDFSGGILAGVESLEKMAREAEVPTPVTDHPQPSKANSMIWLIPVIVVCAVIALLIRNQIAKIMPQPSSANLAGITELVNSVTANRHGGSNVDNIGAQLLSGLLSGALRGRRRHGSAYRSFRGRAANSGGSSSSRSAGGSSSGGSTTSRSSSPSSFGGGYSGGGGATGSW